MTGKAVEMAKSVFNTALFMLRDLNTIDQAAVKNITGLLEQEIRAKDIKDKVNKAFEPTNEEQKAQIDYTGVGGANRGE